jgi:gliding motility-associated lipoprotein GldB
MKRLGIYTCVFVALVQFSCSNHRENIDLQKIDVKVTIKRFDQDLFKVNTDNIHESIPRLSKEYGKFFTLFGEGIIRIGKVEDPEFAGYLESFLTDQMVEETHKKVQEVYPNLDKLTAEFTDAFKRFHYYFPNRCIPRIYTFISGFNQSTVLADSLLGIGLDRYLGSDCSYYPRLGIPKYSINDMKPSKITSDCMRAWAIGEFPFNDSIDNLVNNMIYEGKLMYFTKRMLPDQPDSLIFGFSPSQMKWCEKNEKQIWTYIIENRMLFISDSFTINKYINDAPFSSGFSQESPGRAVVWLGYRIVESYIKNNQNSSFPQLMKMRNYQEIFNQSRYRP